jgi:hypothetical protein
MGRLRARTSIPAALDPGRAPSGAGGEDQQDREDLKALVLANVEEVINDAMAKSPLLRKARGGRQAGSRRRLLRAGERARDVLVSGAAASGSAGRQGSGLGDACRKEIDANIRRCVDRGQRRRADDRARGGAEGDAARAAAHARRPSGRVAARGAQDRAVEAGRCAGMGSRGDAGPRREQPEARNANTVSVSARQAAEQTIAALAAAMKSLPKRPPAPPESRTPRARRGESATGVFMYDTPPPIVYKVTWPATPPEPGLDRRVELDWTRESAGAARLRWNETTPD